jgi:hypothetical protein
VYSISTAENLFRPAHFYEFLGNITSTEEQSSRGREKTTAYEGIGDEAREGRRKALTTSV